ncbi:hypothetical protein JG687_00001189 [Phytophthora cactorum]|uniref:Uncharacterized protein n=1 Tax=Phytophthora cactorum TaxID=29920 RepID=A0A8T1UY06_9STRA|nr:hypothetical protein JG687_00001189 [Phytophthora cactorum]
MTRGSISSVKKAASTAEAPIWKSYLAIRSSTPSDVLNATNASDRMNNTSGIGNLRGRKRAKPSGGAHGPGAGIWMTLATPLTTTREEDGGAVLTSVRHYWKQLSVNERQQILFLDEPELVKQLYKLNLSLLCVGLMQRHLKTSNRTATDTSVVSKTVAATTTSTIAPNAVNSTAVPVVQERAATQPSTRAATDTSLEKTYELLEAMEFMDIGTGILTVKTELAEDTDRLFTLVGDVLAGFLTSIHVLTESNFNKLFVTESETINTWANYQRLIAMLVEQPQEHVLAGEDAGARNPFAGKRKYDEYIVSVPWEDVESDAGSAFDIGSVDGDLFEREDEVNDGGAQQWGRRKQRRRQEDPELEWQLQQVQELKLRVDMALLLRSVTSVSAKRATACALADVVAGSSSVRGFASKKDKKKGKKGGDDGNFEQMLRAIKGQYPDAEEWTEEEKQSHQEIGRRYNTMSTIEHNHFMRDVQTKIDLKWDAINALPAELQAEALEIDVSPVPEERGMATWTPPIPGFRRYTDEGDESMD